MMEDAAPVSSSPKRPKPRLRGLSHAIAFFGSLISGAVMVYLARDRTAATVALVFAACQSALFGISGVYHVPMWDPVRRAWLRRVDHSAIFLLIAGSYTPSCV